MTQPAHLDAGSPVDRRKTSTSGRRATIAAVAAVMAVIGLAACGDDDGTVAEETAASTAAPTTATTTSGPTEVVSVAVERSRLFEQRRSLGVTVRNAGDEPVVVDQLRFAAGRYEEVPATDRTDTAPAGGQVAFPVPYGAARCDSDDEEIVVHLRIDGEDAITRAIRGERIGTLVTSG